MTRPIRTTSAAVGGFLALSLGACGSSTHLVSIDSVSASPDGRTLSVSWWGGGCDQLDTLSPSADETDTTVTLNLTIDAPGRACPSIAIGSTVTLDLARPLGDRTVIDGSTNAELKLDEAKRG